MRTSRYLLLLVLVAVLLAGCASGLERTMNECEEQMPSYSEEMSGLNMRITRALDVAGSVPRDDLSGPVEALQVLRDEVDAIEPPQCVADSHASYLEGVDAYIGFLRDFMANEDPELESFEVDVANLKLLQFGAVLAGYEEDPEAFLDTLRKTAEAATATAEAAPDGE